MKRGNPPRWAIAFFRWLCNDHLSDAVLGDLLELYDRRRATLGKFKADLLFIWNVIQFVQPFAIRKRSSSSVNSLDMISNYFKAATRNMAMNKMHTGITVGGFALGLATCMVIFLFVRNELSYDKHYKDGSRIFRVYNNYDGPEVDKWSSTQPALAGVLKQEIPEVEISARLMGNGMGVGRSALVRIDDQPDNTYEERLVYVDPEMLELLEVPMVFGSASKALKAPQTLVISRRKASQYFGDTNPIGKTMIFNETRSQPYTISGVMEDPQANSFFQYDFVLTLFEKEFWPGEQTDWCCWNYSTYVKLRADANLQDVEKKLIAVRDNYLLRSMVKTGAEEINDFRLHHSYKLQPVEDIWLQQEIGDPHKHGNVTYVWLFSGIAVFILLLACVNFVNLSTARSANRAKEVGLRKVVGAVRSYLIAQFLTESVLFSLVSFAIAVVVVWVALPSFNFVSGRTLTVPWTMWWWFPLLAAASIFIGAIAGLYPSFYLSAFKPIDVLKGKLSRGSRSSALRSGMVVFQFTTSIILIIGTLVVYRQMNFLMNQDLGFKKEQLMILEGTFTLGDHRESFRNELLQLPDVENVSVSGYIPVAGMSREGYGFVRAGKQSIDKPVSAQKWRVDHSYVSTLGMKIVDGRDFNKDIASDSLGIIINQAMARELGLTKPVGERIYNWVSTFTIIGVVQDFNFVNMKEPIRPLALVLEAGGESAMSIRLRSSDMASSIQTVTGLWNRFMPNQPIRFSFLDDKFARMYDDVLRMGRIFAAFSALAIIVACLGLFALSAFMIEQRSKEISIRLVLGAPVRTIFTLLTSNFMKLVLVSFVIAAPLAWVGMDRWLQDYEYRTSLSSDVFMISGGIAVSIALITVSYQSIKAALTKPVENLRRE